MEFLFSFVEISFLIAIIELCVCMCAIRNIKIMFRVSHNIRFAFWKTERHKSWEMKKSHELCQVTKPGWLVRNLPVPETTSSSVVLTLQMSDARIYPAKHAEWPCSKGQKRSAPEASVTRALVAFKVRALGSGLVSARVRD